MQQQHQQQSSSTGTAIADDSTPTSERSISFPTVPPLPAVPPLPTTGHRTSAQLPSNLSTRRGSNQATFSGIQLTGAHQAVPMEHSTSNSSAEWSILGSGEPSGRRSSRDESAFYQAETAMLARENQMLRQRIRELGMIKAFQPHPRVIESVSNAKFPTAERQINELSTSAAHSPPIASHSATVSPAVPTQEPPSSSGTGESSQSGVRLATRCGLEKNPAPVQSVSTTSKSGARIILSAASFENQTKDKNSKRQSTAALQNLAAFRDRA